MERIIIDKEMLTRFEEGLVPHAPESSKIGAEVLGFGEISSIFQIAGMEEVAFKRMPLFRDRDAAEKYSKQYYDYCSLLEKAGLTLPGHAADIVEVPGRPVVLYIAQERYAKGNFVHHMLHQAETDEVLEVIERVVLNIEKVWDFNRANNPGPKLSLDGQLSNWVKVENKLFYIDTSTPMYRKKGVEQMNPEPLLRSAPSFLRWILRLFFLKDVMNRYYDQRLVYIDLAANLYKEQRPDLIPAVVKIINRHLPDSVSPLTGKEIDKYYREDKLIWTLFLAFRRIDRWLTKSVFRKRYEFILPGKIKR
jgi:hypothetical protein